MVCDAGELRRYAPPVCCQNDRQRNGARLAVRDVVHAAERVCDGMDISDIGGRERRARIVRCHEKMLARGQIVTVNIRGVQVFIDELHRVERVVFCALGCKAVGVGLDGVRKGVHAGVRGNVLRQIQCQRRIENGSIRHKAQVCHREFDAPSLVGDDGGGGDL